MNNTIVSIIHDKAIAPFCKLSDRGLQAVFAGFLDVVHLAKGERLELKTSSPLYATVLQGMLNIVGDQGRPIGENVRSKDTAAGPLVIHEPRGVLHLEAQEDTLMILGKMDRLDDIVSIDALVGEEDDDVDVLQLVLMRNAKSFLTLPTPSLLDIYRRMEEVHVEAGEDVVRQDMKGDKYYFIREGAAEVWQEDWEDDEPQHVATLSEGDGFGEEALIVEGGRNATVKMISPGRLLSLDKEDYLDLVSSPSVKRVSSTEAQDLLAAGALLLDVRFEDEWEESHISGCTHIPLTNLRSRVDELNKGADVVVYCRSGRRSQVGAMLLSQLGFNAASMDGGIMEWPGKVTAP